MAENVEGYIREHIVEAENKKSAVLCRPDDFCNFQEKSFQRLWCLMPELPEVK